jgi:hypothetical protein
MRYYSVPGFMVGEHLTVFSHGWSSGGGALTNISVLFRYRWRKSEGVSCG